MAVSIAMLVCGGYNPVVSGRKLVRPTNQGYKDLHQLLWWSSNNLQRSQLAGHFLVENPACQPFWVSIVMGIPQNGWFTMEIPFKMDDLGYPPTLGNLQYVNLIFRNLVASTVGHWESSTWLFEKTAPTSLGEADLFWGTTPKITVD